VRAALGIVEIAYALDLGAPVLDIARQPVFLGPRPDKTALGPLLVDLDVLRHRASSRIASSVRWVNSLTEGQDHGLRRLDGFATAGAGARCDARHQLGASCSSTYRASAPRRHVRSRAASQHGQRAFSRAGGRRYCRRPSRLALREDVGDGGLAFDLRSTSGTSSGGRAVRNRVGSNGRNRIAAAPRGSNRPPSA